MRLVSYAWVWQVDSLGSNPDLRCLRIIPLKGDLSKLQLFCTVTVSRTLALVLPLPFSSSELKTAACRQSKGARVVTSVPALVPASTALSSQRPKKRHLAGSAVLLRQEVVSRSATLFAVSCLLFATGQGRIGWTIWGLHLLQSGVTGRWHLDRSVRTQPWLVTAHPKLKEINIE